MFRLLAAVAVSLLLLVQQAVAYTIEELPLEFDARWLTQEEKRFLQAGLAFQNDYNGMIDGAWGGASQKALERWELRTGGDGYVSNAEVVLLAIEAYATFDDAGWQRQYNGMLDMSFLIPTKGLSPGQPSDNFVNYGLAGTSLGVSLTVGAASQAERLHAYTLGEAASAPYTVRKADIWVTSGTTASGLTLYTRSDFRRGAWSTIMISAAGSDAGLLAAMSGSIARGYAPSIGISPGELSEGVTSLSDYLDSTKPDVTAGLAEPAPRSEPAPEQDHGTAFGTGFRVSGEGDYLTNAHVVEGCKVIKVGDLAATVAATDESFDLALLHVDGEAGTNPAHFAEKPARLNSDITVVGYPLPDLLGGLNVTRGSVTSLKGMGGDAVRMQISAPVQPGNSGGPVLNGEGLVVGVVVSKLDAKLVSDAIGDIPQNVNFAIRAEIAKLFLYQNGVEPIEAQDAESLAPETIADQAQDFTRLITCD